MDIDIMVRLEADLDRIFSTAPRCSGDEAVALRGYPMAPQRSPQAVVHHLCARSVLLLPDPARGEVKGTRLATGRLTEI